MIIQIQFDGGCKPTNPGNKYGSYQVKLNGDKIRIENEFELGCGTNNEAEFESLLRALQWVVEALSVSGLSTGLYAVDILTDSTIVQDRISGNNRKCKSEPQKRMFDLSNKCLAYLIRFKSYEIHWHSRWNNVAAFGH